VHIEREAILRQTPRDEPSCKAFIAGFIAAKLLIEINKLEF